MITWDGWTEATTPASEHRCHYPVVETTEDEMFVLLCYGCNTYWQTGIKAPMTATAVSKRRMIAATETIYAAAKAA